MVSSVKCENVRWDQDTKEGETCANLGDGFNVRRIDDKRAGRRQKGEQAHERFFRLKVGDNHQRLERLAQARLQEGGLRLAKLPSTTDTVQHKHMRKTLIERNENKSSQNGQIQNAHQKRC